MDEIIQQVANKMKIELNHHDIEEAYRVGKPTVGRNRPIVICFSRLRKREEFYNSRKYLRSPSEKIFVNDHLTPWNHKLTYELRQLKKSGNIHSVWTQLGVVKVRVRENANIIRVNNIKDILVDPNASAMLTENISPASGMITRRLAGR